MHYESNNKSTHDCRNRTQSPEETPNPSRAYARAQPSSSAVVSEKRSVGGAGDSSNRQDAYAAALPRNAMAALAECERLFALAFGRQPNDWDVADMLFYTRKGIEPHVIQLAIRATTDARRPTWTYTVAILRKCILEGVQTVEDWFEREERHAARKTKRATAPENADNVIRFPGA